MANNADIRLRKLERILEFSHELTSTMSLEPLLHKIVAAAAELTNSEVAAILLLDKRSEGLRFVATSNLADQLLDVPVPVEGSIGGAALSSGEPVIVRNARDDPRHFKAVDKVMEIETRSLLAVPLEFKEHRIGVLEAENKQGDEEFDQEDVEMLAALAAQATVAIENARLVGALRQSHDELEQRVKERTAELSAANAALLNEVSERMQAEDALRQHTLELEARNEELDAFAHTVAHDLKGPLNTMLGFARVLPETWRIISEDEIEEYLRIVASTGTKMNNIIDELLLLASTRKEEVEAVPLDMASIVAGARQRLGYMVWEYGAEIIEPDSWPLALGYAPWIEEVWVNYLSNAMKYGGRPPRIELGGAEQANGTVRFWIRDNGEGLSPEEQSRLFTPYTQLHRVRARGHGLGLSIVLRIVTKLGGEVGVESQEGQGSTFAFILPPAPPRTDDDQDIPTL
jgi:signal transduction histidine kinase